LTGETQCEPGGQKQPDKSLPLTRSGVRPIDSPFSGVASELQRHRKIGPVTIAPENLPDDMAGLQAALAVEREARQQAEARASSAEALIAHYKLLIAKLRREQYGQSSERGRKLLDQLELQLEEAVARAAEDETAAAPVAGPGLRPFTRRKPVQKAGAGALSGASAARAGGGPGTDRVPLLRRQARQARRDHHRDVGGRAAAMEGDPDRA
jgi:Transposase C of IS166 homeodomain